MSLFDNITVPLEFGISPPLDSAVEGDLGVVMIGDASLALRFSAQMEKINEGQLLLYCLYSLGTRFDTGYSEDDSAEILSRYALDAVVDCAAKNNMTDLFLFVGHELSFFSPRFFEGMGFQEITASECPSSRYAFPLEGSKFYRRHLIEAKL